MQHLPATTASPGVPKKSSCAASPATCSASWVRCCSGCKSRGRRSLPCAPGRAHIFVTVGHVGAIIGLILIPLGWAALRNHLADSRTEQLAYVAATLGYIGSALSISYYGAEVYGLRAIGARALADGDASLTQIGADFRMSPIAATVFATGLTFIAIAAILAAAAIWRSGTLQRWSGVPLAAAMVLYLPHFWLSHAERIGWGVLATIGAMWIAVELGRTASRAPEFQAA